MRPRGTPCLRENKSAAERQNCCAAALDRSRLEQPEWHRRSPARSSRDIAWWPARAETSAAGCRCVVVRRVELPAKAVVERQVGFDLPAILREEIEGGLRSSAPAPRPAYSCSTSEKIVRIGARKPIRWSEPRISARRDAEIRVAQECKDSVYIEVQKLVEALAADVAAKLQRVFRERPS